MTGLSSLTTVTASTKRVPAVSSGKRGTPVANLTSVLITPLAPLSSSDAISLSQTVQAHVLGTPLEMQQTYVEGDLDIVKGDVLTVSNRDYAIRFVEKWPWDGSTRMRLVVEKAGH